MKLFLSMVGNIKCKLPLACWVCQEFITWHVKCREFILKIVTCNFFFLTFRLLEGFWKFSTFPINYSTVENYLTHQGPTLLLRHPSQSHTGSKRLFRYKNLCIITLWKMFAIFIFLWVIINFPEWLHRDKIEGFFFK